MVGIEVKNYGWKRAGVPAGQADMICPSRRIAVKIVYFMLSSLSGDHP
jgi:hypothetical protein